MFFSKNKGKTRKFAGFSLVPRGDSDSRPRAYELDALCALKNDSTYGINNSIAGHLAICGGVLK